MHSHMCDHLTKWTCAPVNMSCALTHFIPIGNETQVGRETVTHVGDYQYIEGEGMPILNTAGKHGNLYVSFFIDFPKALSEEQKQTVRALFA